MLPVFVGRPATPHPLPSSRVPQNPFLAPNPFSNVHNDTWMSDSYRIAGPLGHTPVVVASTLQAARSSTSRLFQCGALTFDRYGRLETACQNPHEGRLVLLDPVTLKVLASFPLPVATSPVQGLGSAYLYLDNRDRAVLAAGTSHIWVVAQTGTRAHPIFTKVHDYDLSATVGTSNINSMMPDWSGRIWFVVRSTGVVGLLDPATGSVHSLNLEGGIDNSFSVTRTASYIVSDKKMYAIAAGSDGSPQVVWSAPYENIGKIKPGQLSAGSGTSPTVLGGGKYVVIADNAEQMHIVVYRTAARLAAHQRRTVCEVPVDRTGVRLRQEEGPENPRMGVVLDGDRLPHR